MIPENLFNHLENCPKIALIIELILVELATEHLFL